MFICISKMTMVNRVNEEESIIGVEIKYGHEWEEVVDHVNVDMVVMVVFSNCSSGRLQVYDVFVKSYEQGWRRWWTGCDGLLCASLVMENKDGDLPFKSIFAGLNQEENFLDL